MRRDWIGTTIAVLVLANCSGEEAKDEAPMEMESARPQLYIEPQDLLAPTPIPMMEPEEPVMEPEVVEEEPAAVPPAVVEPEAPVANPNVHPAWSREGFTCAAEGNRCGACDDTTICLFSEPAACVPRADNDGLTCGAGALAACDPSRPYCILTTCMTLQEASCFCTAQPGDTAAACEQDPSSAL